MQCRNWPDIKSIKIEPANLLDENFPIFVSSEEEDTDDECDGDSGNVEEEVIHISDGSLFDFEDCLTADKSEEAKAESIGHTDYCSFVSDFPLNSIGMGRNQGESTKPAAPISVSYPSGHDLQTGGDIIDDVIDIIDEDEVQFDALFTHFGKASLFEDTHDDVFLKPKQGSLFDLNSDNNDTDGHATKPEDLSVSESAHKTPPDANPHVGTGMDESQCQQGSSLSRYLSHDCTLPASSQLVAKCLKNTSNCPATQAGSGSALNSRSKRAKLLKAEWIEDEDDDLMCLGIEESKWPEFDSFSSLFRDSKADSVKDKLAGTGWDDKNAPEKLSENLNLKDNLDDVDKYFSHKTDQETASSERASADEKDLVKEDITEPESQEIKTSEVSCAKLYICGTCEKGFENSSQLRKHMSKYKHRNCVRCALCKEIVKDLVALELHVRGQHREKNCKCSHCPAAFHSLKQLKRHQRIHDSSQKVFRCEICESAFTQSANLKVHMRSHTGQKPYQCEMCDSAFSHHSNLTRHMRSHSGQKPFVCQICQSAFAVSSQLKVHARLHNQDKPYKCLLCSASFTQSSHLKNHIRIHSGERNYACPECPATFTEASNLRVHQRIHSNQRPYVCTLCTSSFSQLSSLKRHMATHTGSNLLPCPQCSATFRQPAHLQSHLLMHSQDKPWLKGKDGAPRSEVAKSELS